MIDEELKNRIRNSIIFKKENFSHNLLRKVTMTVFLGIILLAIIFYFIIFKNNKIKDNKIPLQNTTPVILLSLKFPGIQEMSVVKPTGISPDIKIFTLPLAVNQTYSMIKYDSKEIGYQYSYIVHDSTIKKVMLDILNQIGITKNKSTWTLMSGGGAGVNGSFLIFIIIYHQIKYV